MLLNHFGVSYGWDKNSVTVTKAPLCPDFLNVSMKDSRWIKNVNFLKVTPY